MKNKFELTNITKEVNGKILYQIRALKDFGNVKKGDLGGWLERIESLSQEGNAWVYKNACVFKFGEISGGEIHGGVIHGGEISGGVIRGGVIRGGEISGGEIHGGVIHGGVIRGGEISGGLIWGGVISGGEIHGGVIRGGEIHGGEIRGGMISGGLIWGGLIWGGVISGGEIHGGVIKLSTDYLIIGPIGSRNGILTVTFSDQMISTGCFYGNLDTFEKKVNETHKENNHKTEYTAAIELIKKLFETRCENDN